MEILLILVPVAIVAAAIRGTLAWIRRKQPVKPTSLSGVAGWLAALVVSMMTLWPMLGGLALYGELSRVEERMSTLRDSAPWQTFTLATWVWWAASTALGVFAGHRLVRTRTRPAVRVAIVALWVAGPVSAIMSGLVIPLMAFGTLRPNPDATSALTSGTLFAILWTVYLLRSRRVAATYANQ